MPYFIEVHLEFEFCIQTGRLANKQARCMYGNSL